MSEADRPNAQDLLAASAHHLDLVLAGKVQLDRYAVRLVRRALGIAGNDLADGGSVDEAELSSLIALLHRTGPVAELRRHLADDIRSARIALDDPALVQHLVSDCARRAALAEDT